MWEENRNMSRSIPVKSEGQVIYTIELMQDFSKLVSCLTRLGYQKDQRICIVTDSNVEPLYAKEVQSLLANAFETVIVYTFPAGEANKNLETVYGLYQTLIEAHFDRRDLLVALGGGVVGDLCGFTAATYLRGIDFIQVPTTLLAQVDSSIGGKTGVDFLQYKNMVGAFCQPKLVYMNLSVLKSLPQKQLVSGMGEIIKHGLIKDVSYYKWLDAHHDDILSLDPKVTEEMIARSCDIKRQVVELDPTEKGDRALLNFGHTIGHAIEKLCNFSLYHGECVGLGMISAAYLSLQLNNITEDEFEDIKNCLKNFGFKSEIRGIAPDEVLAVSKSDKKMVGKQVKFILLSSVGNAYIYRELTDVQILDAIAYVCKG